VRGSTELLWLGWTDNGCWAREDGTPPTGAYGGPEEASGKNYFSIFPGNFFPEK